MEDMKDVIERRRGEFTIKKSGFDIKIPYEGTLELICNDLKPRGLLPHNQIQLNPFCAESNGIHENDVLALVHEERRSHMECVVRYNEAVAEGEVSAAKYVFELLEMGPGTKVTALILAHRGFSRTLTQDIAAIKSGSVGVSEKVYNEIDRRYSIYQIIHPASSSVMNVPVEKIVPSVSCDENTIKLSRYQRNLLNLSTPGLLGKSIYDAYQATPLLSREEKETLKEKYENESRYIPKDYSEEKSVYVILKKAGYEELRLFPCVDSLRSGAGALAALKSFVQKFLAGIGDFFVGSGEVTLLSARPYDMDEGKDIIRISNENLIHLGLEKNDQVIVKYRGRKIKTRTFVVDDIALAKETNILNKDEDINKIVGIPVHLRRKLHVHNLNVSVCVSRSPWYIFKKHLNAQFLPVIALLFTLMQTFQDNMRQIVIWFIISLPFVIYIGFSVERSKLR